MRNARCERALIMIIKGECHHSCWRRNRALESLALALLLNSRSWKILIEPPDCSIQCAIPREFDNRIVEITAHAALCYFLTRSGGALRGDIPEAMESASVCGTHPRHSAFL
jgi:hypothetical protein